MSGEIAVPCPTHRTTRTWPILLVLCLFAALIPETVFTSSTSPLAIARSPISLLFITAFYGPADLVIREIMVRRRSGLAAVLLLGAGFGFINEGVAAGTWYTVQPTGYAFIGGIDWVWVVALTVFHTIISVIVPIAFIEILFPSIRGRSLVGRRGIAIALFLFVGVTLLTFTPSSAIARFVPDRLIVWAIAAAMWLVALWLPSRRQHQPRPLPVPGPWPLRLIGFGVMVGFFAVVYVAPSLTARVFHPAGDGLLAVQALDAAAILVYTGLVVARGWSWLQRAAWSRQEALALLIGAVAWSTLILCLAQWQLGAPIASIPFLVWLVALSLKSRPQTAAASAA